MASTQLFQARDHGNGVLEIIAIFPDMAADHPAINAVLLLSRKFPTVIVTLEPGASMDAGAFGKLIEASGATRLLVATSDQTAHPFARAGIRVFPSGRDALLFVRGEEIARHIVTQMESIPELHSQAFELLQKLNEPSLSFERMGETIAREPGLATQILKTANSAFFMRRSKVDTIPAALTVLGLEGLKQILIVNVFKGLTGYFGAQKEVLDHGRVCAQLAVHLAELRKVPRTNLAKIRLGGLLHDIGSLALVFYYPKEYAEVRSLMKTQGKRSYEAETAVFGIEHQSLGKRLAEKWGFPDYLCSIIGDHHSLSDKSQEELTDPICCANGFMNQVIESIPYTPYYQRLRAYFSTLSADQDQLTVGAVQEELKKRYVEFLSTDATIG